MAELSEKKTEIRNVLLRQERENYGMMGGMAGIGYAAICGIEGISKLLKVECV